MFDLEIAGRDPGVPDLFKTSFQKFEDIGSLLFDIFSFPKTYKKFPVIPQDIFDYRLKRVDSRYSIIKKGEAYYIVLRGDKGGRFIETFHPFSIDKVVFVFTSFDFPTLCEIDIDSHDAALQGDIFNTLVYDILQSQ